MRLDANAWPTAVLSIALWLPGCSSGLPPKPMVQERASQGSAPGGAGQAVVAGAGTAGQAAAGVDPPAAGRASAGLSGVGEACRAGANDCRPGLRCVANTVGARTVQVCALACNPDDDTECTPGDDD